MEPDSGRGGAQADPGFRIGRIAGLTVVGALLFLGLWQAGKMVLPPAQRTLTLYGYSVLDEVIEDGIFPAFRDLWRQRTGEEVELIATFAASGTVTDRILDRFPAEVAILASELDARRLAPRGSQVRDGWERLPHGGVVHRSPVVILVREGNPKGIAGFEDLAGDGIAVVHPDPATSGAGQWAILSAYGAARRRTGDPERAFGELLGLWRNVTAQPPSARLAQLRFEAGDGDALVTYEQLGLPRQGRPPPGEIVYPPATMVSEHLAVPVGSNVTRQQRELVWAFLDYLWSAEAQRTFVAYGFRSVDEELNRAHPGFRPLEAPLTLADLGGPDAARREVLDGLWRTRIRPTLGR